MKSIKLSLALLSLLSVIATTALAMEMQKQGIDARLTQEKPQTDVLEAFVLGAGAPDMVINVKDDKGNVATTVYEYSHILPNGKKMYAFLKNGEIQSLNVNGESILKRSK